MAKAKKRTANKTEPARSSKKMAKVRPLQGKPAIGKSYDHGFKEPPARKSPWVDEGTPEPNG
jgi:hypothetical protein